MLIYFEQIGMCAETTEQYRLSRQILMLKAFEPLSHIETKEEVCYNLEDIIETGIVISPTVNLAKKSAKPTHDNYGH